MLTGRSGKASCSRIHARQRFTQASMVGLWPASLPPDSWRKVPENSISLLSTQAARLVHQPQRATV